MTIVIQSGVLRDSGYDNLNNFPSAINRPVYDSGTSTLTWIGPNGSLSGASTSHDVVHNLVLTDAGGGLTIAPGDAILSQETINIPDIGDMSFWILEGYYITGFLTLNSFGSDNLCIRRCFHDFQVDSFTNLLGGRNFLMLEDSEFATAGHTGGQLGATDAEFIRRCNIHDCTPFWYLGQGGSPPRQMIDTWAHHPNNPLDGSPHYDGIQAITASYSAPVSNVKILHNTIENDQGQTDCIILQANDTDITDVTIDGNRIIGSDTVAWSLEFEDNSAVCSNIVVTNNRFSTSPGFLIASSGISTWSGNVHDEDGSPWTSP